MKKRNKLILGSVMSIAMCASLIAGSTYALFSSESTTNIAITAGKVEVTASVENLKWFSLGTESTDAVDNAGSFVPGGTFSYAAGELKLSEIAAGDGVEFDLSVKNTSTIAIRYQTRIGSTVGADGVEADAEKSAELLNDLRVTVNGADPIPLKSTYATDWSGRIDAGADIAETTHIRLELSEESNAQGGACTISVAVYAVQANAHITEEAGTSGFKIYNTADFNTLATLVNSEATYEEYKEAEVHLMGNVDFNAASAISVAYVLADHPVAASESGWTPIGSAEHPFMGSFEGHGHTIYNFSAKAEGDGAIGLFGVVGGEVSIKNVTLVNATVDASEHECEAGILVGSVQEGGTLEVEGVAVSGGVVKLHETKTEMSSGGLVGSGETTLKDTVSDAVLESSTDLGYTMTETWDAEGALASVSYVGDRGTPANPDSYSGIIHDTIITTQSNVEYIFKRMKFTGNTHIATNASKLTVTESYIDVTTVANTDPEWGFVRLNGGKIEFTDNTVYGGGTGAVIIGWGAWVDGDVFSGNTFGSAERPYSNKYEAIIKGLDITSANEGVTIADNTFYVTREDVAESPTKTLKVITTHQMWSKTYNANIYVKGNTVHDVTPEGIENPVEWYFMSIEAAQDFAHQRIYTSDNTIVADGETRDVGYADFAISPCPQAQVGVVMPYDLLGWNVTLTEENKIESGVFVLGTSFTKEDILALAATEESKSHILIWNQSGGLPEDSEGNLHLSTPDDVKSWHEILANHRYDSNNQFANKPVILDNDITMQDDGWVWSMMWLQWADVPTTKLVFDGQNHTISNLKIQNSMFGGNAAHPNNTVEIKNVTFDHATVTSEYESNADHQKYNSAGVAVLFGTLYDKALIENVHIANSSVTGGTMVGAFVGATTPELRDVYLTVRNCSVSNTTLTATNGERVSTEEVPDMNPAVGVGEIVGCELSYETNDSSELEWRHAGHVTLEGCSVVNNTVNVAQGLSHAEGYNEVTYTGTYTIGWVGAEFAWSQIVEHPVA